MPPKASGSRPAKRSKRAVSSDDDSDAEPLPIAEFLSQLQSTRGLTIPEALRCGAMLLKAGYKSASALDGVTADELAEAGIADEAIVRKLVAKPKRRRKNASAPTDMQSLIASGSKERGPAGANWKDWHRDRDLDQPLPAMDGSTPRDERNKEGDLDFDEELDESVLIHKHVVVNRSPIMMAWATIVAEQLNFSREEALSIAQAYTDANAASKGVSIGVLPESRRDDYKMGSSQPHVELMGRKVPVMSVMGDRWRGLSAGKVCDPVDAFGYIHRALRQQMGAVIGSMRLLATSFDPETLNKKGYGLYLDFRPPDGQWAARSSLQMSEILALRPTPPEPEPAPADEDFDALLADDDGFDDALLAAAV